MPLRAKLLLVAGLLLGLGLHSTWAGGMPENAVVVPGSADVSGFALPKRGRALAANLSVNLSSPGAVCLRTAHWHCPVRSLGP